MAPTPHAGNPCSCQVCVDERAEPEPGFIYFIRCGSTGAIKIGYTRSDPRRRLRNLQTANPAKLELLLYVDGSPARERELHEICHSARLEGEWFTDGPAVQYLMQQYRKGYQLRANEIGYAVQAA